MLYHGDITLGDTLDIKFTTVDQTGLPTTLAGGVAAAYPSNSVTEITTGITLTVDLDGRTGYHNVRVVATSGNGYLIETNYSVVLTAGTVAGISVVGYEVGAFSIQHRLASIVDGVWDELADSHLLVGSTGSRLASTESIANTINVNVGTAGAGLTSLPAATIRAAIGMAAANLDSQISSLRSLATGTADSGTTTTLVDAARTEGDIDYWKGSLVQFTNGTLLGQARLVTAFDPATDTLTFAPATTVAVGTHTYELLPWGRVDLHFVLGAIINALISGRVDANAQVVGDKTGYAIGVGGIPSTAFAAGAIDAAAIAAGAIGASEIADGAIDAATFATGAIDANAFAQGAADKVWSTTARTLTSGVVKKNTAFSNIEFLMVDSTDHVTPKTGLTVAGTRSIDGGAFEAVSGSLAQVGNGIYQFDALAADTNGDVVTYRFTSPGADDTFITITTST